MSESVLGGSERRHKHQLRAALQKSQQARERQETEGRHPEAARGNDPAATRSRSDSAFTTCTESMNHISGQELNSV